MAYIPGGRNGITLEQSRALQNKRKADAKKKAEQAAQRQGANLTGQAISGSLGTPSTPAAVKAVADAVAAATNTKPTVTPPTFTPPKSNNSSNSNRSAYTPPPAVKPPVSVTGGNMVRGGNVPTRKQEPPKYQYGSGKPIANPKSGGGSAVSGEYAGSGKKSGVNKEFGRDSNRSTYEQRMASQRLANERRLDVNTTAGAWAQAFDPVSALIRVGTGGTMANELDDNSAENYGALDAGLDLVGAIPLVGGFTKGIKAVNVANKTRKVANIGTEIVSNMDTPTIRGVLELLPKAKKKEDFIRALEAAAKTVADDLVKAEKGLAAVSTSGKAAIIAKQQAVVDGLKATIGVLDEVKTLSMKKGKEAAQHILDALDDLAKNVGDDLGKGAKNVGDDLVEGATNIGKGASNVADDLGKGAKNVVDEMTEAVKKTKFRNPVNKTLKKAEQVTENAAKEIGAGIGVKAARDLLKAEKIAAKAAKPRISLSGKGLVGALGVAAGGGAMLGASMLDGGAATGEEGQEFLYDAILGPDTTDTTDTTATDTTSSDTPSGPTTPSIDGVAPPLNTPFGEIPFYQNPNGTITGINSKGDTVFQTSIYSVDENGDYVETPGYIINGQTYFDAEGTQRLPEGGQYAVVNPYYTGEEGSTQPMLWGMDSIEGGNPTLTAEELENYFLDNIQDEEDMTTFDSFMEPYKPYLEAEYARIDAEVEAQIRALREEAAARGLYNSDAMLMMEQEIRAAGEAQKTSLYASVLAEVQAKYMDYLTRKEDRAQELYMYETSLDFDRQRADTEDQQWLADFQQKAQRSGGSGGGSSVVTPPLPSEAYNILSYYQDLFEDNPSQQAFTSRMYGLADALRGAGYDDATVRQFLSEFSSRITSMYPEISPYK